MGKKKPSSKYMDVLEKLLQADQEACKRVERSREKAREILEQARKDAESLLERSRKEADSEAKRIVEEAEKQAVDDRNKKEKKVVGEPAVNNAGSGRDFLEKADENIDGAAELIVQWVSAKYTTDTAKNS